MADFTNRSPFIVTVARRPTLKRIFALLLFLVATRMLVKYW